MTHPLISVVFGSYNRHNFLKLTLNTVRSELAGISHEIIVIDGGSNDGALEYLLQQKDVITIVQHNRGVWNDKPIERRSWGYFMNLGFKIAQGKYICMVSDDCLLVPGAIKRGIEFFEQKLACGEKVGAVAFWWRNWMLEQLDYKICKFFHDKIYLNHGLYLAHALQEIGYADEEAYAFYAGDVDVCLRMRQKNYTCIAAPDSYVEHYPHAGLGVRKGNEALMKKDVQALLSRWGSTYGHDLGMCDDARSYSDLTKTGELFRLFEYEPAVVVHRVRQNFRWHVKRGIRFLSNFFKK